MLADWMNVSIAALAWLVVGAHPHAQATVASSAVVQHTAAAAPTQVPDSVALEPNEPVSHTGTPGASYRYTVDLHSNDFLELHLAQAAGAADITVVGPDGLPVRQISLIDGAPADLHVLLVAAEAGRYQVNLQIAKTPPIDAPYTLRIVAQRPADAHDRSRDACFTSTAEGNRLARLQQLANLGQAISTFEQAGICWRQLDDRILEIETLRSLGNISSLFSQFSAQSIAAYSRLAEIHRAAGETALELTSLEHVVREHSDDGHYDRALEAARRVHALASALGSRPREARALHSIALASLLLGDYERSRQAATAALDLASTIADPTTQGLAHYDLARLDELAGDFDAAHTRYQQALATGSPDRTIPLLVTLHLGWLHLQQGHYDEAEKRLRQRLELAAVVIQREQEAFARIGLGDVQMARGDRAGAAALYTAAREELARTRSWRACIAEERLGRLDLQDGRLDEAAMRFEQMLIIGERNQYLPCIAQGRAAMADLALGRGDLDAATTDARVVIELNERLRATVPNLESRALGFGSMAPAFERAIDIAMLQAARGDRQAVTRAFELSERARARGLLDQIAESTVERQALPQALADQRQQLREQWRARLAALQIAARSSATHSRVDALSREVSVLELQIRNLDVTADAADSRRPGLLRPPSLLLSGVQALLDPDTQLLEYALGEQRSYLWVVSATDIRAFTLAPRADISAAARAVYDGVAAAATAAGPAAQAHRRTLSRLILEPAHAAITARRLIIVSSGALALVPFGALPPPAPAEAALAMSANLDTMLARYEIVHIPSATTLVGMRQLTATRPRPGKTAVILADPIFEAADTRARGGSGPRAARQPASGSGPSLPRLPFSRVEARAISAMRPGEITMFTDGQATRARVLGRALEDYRVIHFATHGLVHPEIASLSSIVLSLVDETGRTQDPFVRLADIYEMRLNADVVVLSACSTAAGKNVPGEGPIGLARAFMHAGAPRVVASLWQVNDSATAELMKRFYRGMWIDGLSAAAALRRAQQQLAALPRWASPYFWAGFVLQGDWQ